MHVNGQVESIYKQILPLVNEMNKPGVWNTFDIIYMAPTFKKDGIYLTPSSVAVLQNGILLQNNTIIRETTLYVAFPEVIKPGDVSILLQDHGDLSVPISFRSIWIRGL